MGFGPAKLNERAFVRQLLIDAREVIGDHAKLGTLVIDRGFMSGPGLWAIAQMGLRFVTPAKRRMNGYKEARGMVMGEAEGTQLYPKRCERKVRHRPEGGGKLRTVTPVIEVVGVEGGGAAHLRDLCPGQRG